MPNPEHRQWYITIYKGYHGRLLIGYKYHRIPDCGLSVYIYFPFIEIFCQRTLGYYKKRFWWGGIR